MKPYSPYPTVPDLLAARAATDGNRVALTFEGASLTYGELDERSTRVANWLLREGVSPGDRIALMQRNSPEFLDAFFGAAKAGAVAVPINTAMIGDSLAYILEHAGPVGVIADSDLLDVVDQAGSFSTVAWRAAAGEGGADAVAFDELLADGLSEPLPAVEAGTPMSIVYTSGTTGMPKGVVLPHQSYTNTGAYFATHLRLTDDDHLHTCLPLFHCNAQQTTLMAGLVRRLPVTISARFSVSRFWSWIEQSGATVTNLLGTMVTLLEKVAPQPQDAGNPLRYVVAAPVPEQLHRPFEDRFGVTCVEGYGLSETGTMACINPVDDVRPGTIGVPLPYGELRIVDEHEHEVARGTPGEILIRTHIPHSVMLGYFREPEKTAEAMRGGWFHSGDLGKQREDGYFVFLDRMKDTIRRRGENISSFLVEKAILQHPAVLACAAVGVPSELGEEDVKIVIVTRPGAHADAAEIIDWSAARMADFMVPRYVEFRAELPMTETGRVHKYKLRDEGIGRAWDRAATLTGSP